MADAAEDVRAIADHYRLDEFAVLGRSGGGPHALACAALLPDRVTRVASLVSLAPFDAPGLDWLAGMTEFNRVQYSAASKGSKELARVLYPQVVAMRADPEHLVRRLEAQAPDEHPQLRDPALRDAMVTSIAEAVSRTLEGWAADSLAFTHSWGFDPAWISAPTLLWHVEGDVFSPVAHAHWLAERIRSAVLTLSGRGHLSAGDAQGGAIRWLLHGGPANLASA